MTVKKFDNFVNEDITEYLKPKSEKEILKSVWLKLKKLTPIQQLNYISTNNLIKIMPNDYMKSLVDFTINDMKNKTMLQKIRIVFDSDLSVFFTDDYKKELIQEILKVNSDILKHKNIIRVHNSEWSFVLFINEDNLECILIGLYAAKEVWKTINKLI